MKSWSLNAHDPICLTLSADARFGSTDYSNDQIWELGWWGDEIPSIWLRSSFGRRIQSMQIFPAFALGGSICQDPQAFAQAVRLKRVFPNLASLACKPFKELLVEAEYYIPDSHGILGQYTLTNLSDFPQVVNLRLSAHLLPGGDANPMGLVEMQGVATLSGRATNIYPVVIMSGGARKAPAAYPSLQVSATLAPGGSKTWNWAHAAFLQPEAAFEHCRQLIQIPWEPTLARIEMGNVSMIRIETGDPDWDSALWMSQKELLRSFIGPSIHSSRPGMVGRREMDDGYALSQDGKDHTGPWGGLSTADVYYLARQALPIAPELVKDVVRGILRTQNKAGELDWAPGMGGQRASYQAMPLIADLVWECFRCSEDRRFLDEVFPGLFSFYEAWFTSRHDRDGDGFPEWDHGVQSGLEDRPLFNRFDPLAQGFDISHAEAVDLAAYLYKEGRALISIAEVLGRKSLTTVIEERIGVLERRVEASWDEKRSSYMHVDRDSHRYHGGLQLVRRRGESTTRVDRQIDPPAKLVLRLKGDPAYARQLQVKILSEGARKRKRVESLTHRKFQSFWEWSTHTTEKLNHRVHRITIMGIDQKMTMEVLIPDLEREDLTMALPLWAGWVNQTRARSMVEHSINNAQKYDRKNGLSLTPATDKSFASDGMGAQVHTLLNSLVGQGLVDHGYRAESGKLFEKLINVVILALKREKRFWSSYHPDEVRGLGLRGGIVGILPLDLFLAVLGVRLISPTKVWVNPGHPFPWPVRIDWRGLSLLCESDTVHIQFPDGGKVTVEGNEGRLVEQLEAPV